jgi:integrase
MNASISVICYKSKTLSNGENPLMVRISKNGKRKYQSLGISVNQVHWDFIKEKPKANCPNGEYIQKIILDKIQALQFEVIELKASNSEFTPTSLLDKSKTKIKVQTVGEFYKELIKGFESSQKTGNRLIYKGSINSIKAFSKGKTNFQFSDIDLDWLKRYEKWLRLKGNKETTISLLFRTLRSAYNKAIECKCTNKSHYPFNDFKISKFDVSTSKRAISKEDIQLIMNVDLTGERGYVQFAKDVFVFSYLCGGINFTDLSNLKAENVAENRLVYVRQKTGKKISLQISLEAQRIIDKHEQVNLKSGFIFPILDKQVHKTPIQVQNRIHKVLGKIDIGLKRVAELKHSFNK